jgi:putative transposase
VTDAVVAELAPQIGVRAACAGSVCGRGCRAGRLLPAAPNQFRAKAARARGAPRSVPAPRPGRAGTARNLDVLPSPRFVDFAPAEVWATLLDEGVYLGSISTFYRLLRRAQESRQRRRQATHPASVKPELVTSAPNQVWSWDITKLRARRNGPATTSTWC